MFCISTNSDKLQVLKSSCWMTQCHKEQALLLRPSTHAGDGGGAHGIAATSLKSVQGGRRPALGRCRRQTAQNSCTNLSVYIQEPEDSRVGGMLELGLCLWSGWRPDAGSRGLEPPCFHHLSLPAPAWGPGTSTAEQDVAGNHESGGRRNS